MVREHWWPVYRKACLSLPFFGDSLPFSGRRTMLRLRTKRKDCWYTFGSQASIWALCQSSLAIDTTSNRRPKAAFLEMVAANDSVSCNSKPFPNVPTDCVYPLTPLRFFSGKIVKRDARTVDPTVITAERATIILLRHDNSASSGDKEARGKFFGCRLSKIIDACA